MFATRFGARSSRPRCSKSVKFLLILFILQPLNPAIADLMIAPTRIIFEKNERSAQIDLINSGVETVTYRINVVNRRMSETGGFSAIDSPAEGEQFADAFLRYSPRQIVLAPGEGQVVRIMLRKPADMPAGEYRSHLLFNKVAAVQGATDIESQGALISDVSIQLTMLVGLSIPIIVRHGDTAATVALTDLELVEATTDQPATLALVLRRTGNRSVYGDLSVRFTPKGGVPYNVSQANGVAVYTPNLQRRVNLKLQDLTGQVLTQGKLTVSFSDQPEAGGKLLTEAVLNLP